MGSRQVWSGINEIFHWLQWYILALTFDRRYVTFNEIQSRDPFYCQRLTKIMPCLSNYNNGFLWHVIIHPRFKLNGDLAKHGRNWIWHYNDVLMGAIASQINSLRIVYSTVYLGADQRKYQSSASLAFVRGIHRGPVNYPHKWRLTGKMFPFDDVTMDERLCHTLLWCYLSAH